MKNCTSNRFDIERYFVGELDKDSAQAVEKHLETCESCFTYLQNLRRERNEFLADHPFSSFYAEKAQKKTPFWQKYLSPAFARPVLVPVVCLLLIIAAIPVVNTIAFNSGRETVVFKGGAQLSFIYERDGKIHDGILSEVFHEGDRIQVVYNSPREWFVALLSIDQSGTVSFYHPDQKSITCSVPSGKGNDLYFPGSIILDNSSGGELVVAVFSHSPLKTSDVKESVSAIAKKHSSLKDIEAEISKFSFSKGSQTATLLLRKE